MSGRDVVFVGVVLFVWAFAMSFFIHVGQGLARTPDLRSRRSGRARRPVRVGRRRSRRECPPAPPSRARRPVRPPDW